jgi:hypothetical protein
MGLFCCKHKRVFERAPIERKLLHGIGKYAANLIFDSECPDCKCKVKIEKIEIMDKNVFVWVSDLQSRVSELTYKVQDQERTIKAYEPHVPPHLKNPMCHGILTSGSVLVNGANGCVEWVDPAKVKGPARKRRPRKKTK